MMEQPHLTQLSEQEKDQLILDLLKYISQMEQKIKQLEERLSKDSHNSSKPPSSDGYHKPNPQSRRNKEKGKKKVGGQPGHPGKTLNRTEHPNFIVEHDPERCWRCTHTLSTHDRVVGYESRQVY